MTSPQNSGQPNPYAAPPVPQQEMAGAGPAPTTLNRAFWIAVAVPALFTVLGLVSMVMRYGTVDEIVASSPAPVTEATIVTGMVMSGLLYAVLTGLWILFGFKMRAGHNWARITLTVFAGLWIISALLGFAGAGLSASMSAIDVPTGVLVLGYMSNGIALVSMIAFIALAYLKPSNWYFQAASGR